MSNELVTIRQGIEKRGIVHRSLKFLYHRITKNLIVWCLRVFNKKGYGIIIKPFATFTIPVNLIEFKVESPVMPLLHWRFLNYEFRTAGIVDGADWDLHLVKFEETGLYLALKERFVESKEWEDTMYSAAFQKYKGHKEVLFSTTWDEYKEKRLKLLDHLYHDMKVNGYKKQINPEDEVSVAISRNGQILFIDGHHRLTMAKILQMKSIPVFINMWHKQYIEKLQYEGSNQKVTSLQAFEKLGIGKRE